MLDPDISSLSVIEPTHARLLANAGIRKLSDVWAQGVSEYAKKLRVTTQEFQAAVDDVCRQLAPKPRLLKHDPTIQQGCFTTGDLLLDKALGGGIRLGGLTEICGESAAGKTQLALQLALTSQLKAEQGGIEAGVAYFSTTSSLPVTRLTQMARNHPLLRLYDAKALTDNIHTSSTTTVSALLSVFKIALPNLFRQLDNGDGRLRPIRVVIVDSLGSLFHSLDKTTTNTLVERSRILGEISQILHNIVSTRHVAVIVINQVTDVFASPGLPYSFPMSNGGDTIEDGAYPELIYKEQSVWFNRGPMSLSSNVAREATMGLIWANQLNTRIIIARTRRRIRTDDDDQGDQLPSKRRKVTEAKLPAPMVATRLLQLPEEEEGEGSEMEAGTVVRTLSVVFSSVCAPCTMDFIIVKEGLRVTDFKSDVAIPKSVLAKQSAPEEPKQVKEAPKVPSQGFISARLTQTQPQLEEEVVNELQETEDFDAFDEEEWANYGEALGDLEEQWDPPEAVEPDNHPTSAAPSDHEGTGDEDEVLESSDVEENFLLENVLENKTQV